MAQNVSELAQRLNRRNAKGQKIPPLLLMTDTERLPDPSALIPKLPAGSGIIIRHFSREEKIKLIFKVKKLCRKHKVLLLVSDDTKLALSMQCDGVHFSELSLKKAAGIGKALKTKPSLIYTCACHSQRFVHAAQKAKMDAILISPVFKTNSHPNAHTKGSWGFQNLARQTHLHCFGLGGLNKKTAQQLIQTRACGFAGIGNLL